MLIIMLLSIFKIEHRKIAHCFHCLVLNYLEIFFYFLVPVPRISKPCLLASLLNTFHTTGRTCT